jgi:hypothetical protein
MAGFARRLQLKPLSARGWSEIWAAAGEASLGGRYMSQYLRSVVIMALHQAPEKLVTKGVLNGVAFTSATASALPNIHEVGECAHPHADTTSVMEC